MPTFATPGPISATIELLMGDIRVIATDRTDTVVEVRPRDPANDSDVKAAAETRVEYADGQLTVKAPKPLQVYFGRKTIVVDVAVQLPAGSHLRGHTSHGELRAEGLLGACAFKTASGDITLDRAASVSLTTPDGRVTVERVAGDAHVTGSGDIRVREIAGKASVKNLNGASWVGTVAGDIHVNSAHGNIEVDHAGAAVTARTAYGDIRVGDVSRAAVVLHTASGDLEVGVREGAAAWLDLKSMFGNVRNELEATAGPEPATDTVEIKARTANGDIVIRRANPTPTNEKE